MVRKGKQSKRIRRAVGAGGRFTFRFQVGNPGTLRLVVKHAATPQQAAFRATDRTINVVSWQAGEGARGHARAPAPARTRVARLRHARDRLLRLGHQRAR